MTKKFNPKKVMQKSKVSTKYETFDYTLNNVNLNFKIRTDIKQDLKDFKEILETALIDVNLTIDEIKE